MQLVLEHPAVAAKAISECLSRSFGTIKYADILLAYSISMNP